jgi:hypothetical protein
MLYADRRKPRTAGTVPRLFQFTRKHGHVQDDRASLPINLHNQANDLKLIVAKAIAHNQEQDGSKD